ncbi:Glycerol-3-phosphate dehydrogenase [Pseudomonas chlororaphis]|nr:Glycerol-3-phosphate dehydrogenase [Pseudomonas chlororaphis]
MAFHFVLPGLTSSRASSLLQGRCNTCRSELARDRARPTTTRRPGDNDSCSRCRAHEAAIVCAADARAVSPIGLRHRVVWFGVRFAADRSLASSAAATGPMSRKNRWWRRTAISRPTEIRVAAAAGCDRPARPWRSEGLWRFGARSGTKALRALSQPRGLGSGYRANVAPKSVVASDGDLKADRDSCSRCRRLRSAGTAVAF